MAIGFVYQPHVQTAEGVLSPDLVIDRLSILDPNGAPHALAVDLLTTDPALQQVGATACGNAALVLVSAGRGTVATVGSAHWDPALTADHVFWLGFQIAAKPISREAVRLSMLAGDLGGFVLRTHRLEKGESQLIGETPLADLPGIEEAVARWSAADAPANAVLMIAAGHADPSPAGADGYRVELGGATGGRTASLAYSVEQLDI